MRNVLSRLKLNQRLGIIDLSGLQLVMIPVLGFSYEDLKESNLDILIGSNLVISGPLFLVMGMVEKCGRLFLSVGLYRAEMIAQQFRSFWLVISDLFKL